MAQCMTPPVQKTRHDSLLGGFLRLVKNLECLKDAGVKKQVLPQDQKHQET